jgi:membrane protein implicated in regulation of membrane protease activity
LSSELEPSNEPPRQQLRKYYRVLKWVVIALIAASMAEFLALDMAMLVATDLVFYFELLVAGWAMAAFAFLNPALGYRFIMLGSRVFGGTSKPDRETPDER